VCFKAGPGRGVPNGSPLPYRLVSMHLFASWYNRICDSCLFHDHKHVSKEWNIFFFFLCILYRCSLRIDTWNSVDYIKVLSLKTLLLLCLNLSCKLKSLINSEKPQSTGGLWMPWRATFLRFPAWVTAAITLGRLLVFFFPLLFCCLNFRKYLL
jgi:hypothetical protein